MRKKLGLSDDEIRNSTASVPERLVALGGLRKGNAKIVSEQTGVPEADVYGVGSFFHLLSDPDTKVRICQGLSCQMQGSKELLERAQALGFKAKGAQCLAACDRPIPLLRDRRVLVEATEQDLIKAGDDYTKITSNAGENWRGHVGPKSNDNMAMNLLGALNHDAKALNKIKSMTSEAVIELLEESALQGRGGAGFPAHIKWRGVCAQKESTRYVVLNADEGEPGTFKDRELLTRRPDLVLEGLAIAAHTIGAKDVYLYLRGEFEIAWEALKDSLESFGDKLGVNFHFHEGHGAYICGEETALLEALEGKRGMPRLKPPFPTEVGLWGKPTLIHNVETVACLPSIVLRGGEWFKSLGRKEAGSKLYCISGDVEKPGVYELPLGVTLDELLEAAGGMRGGELYAFSPGGASSGFLPASESDRPLSFKALSEVGSMLGSAGVVVLNNTRDMAWAVREQLRFFEDESCGQCAPCRIGTRFIREAVDRSRRGEEDKGGLSNAAEVAWEMNEGSICGLGQAAPLPLTSALKYFPEAFEK